MSNCQLLNLGSCDSGGFGVADLCGDRLLCQEILRLRKSCEICR
ncbi:MULTISPECIES: hypothetical protein [Oscillatoriales]|nr:hypothetical protein [Limnospira sp. PMC 289.06]MDT9310130.1 hypothetical protein [Limnospira sp. Paracas R14]WAK74097.1 hypothetical protein AP9108_36755 [Arthrospira sp. PCC 9108]